MRSSTTIIYGALTRNKAATITPTIQKRPLSFMGDSFNPFDDPFDPLNPINQVMIQNQKNKQTSATESKKNDMQRESKDSESAKHTDELRPRLSADY